MLLVRVPRRIVERSEPDVLRDSVFRAAIVRNQNADESLDLAASAVAKTADYEDFGCRVSALGVGDMVAGLERCCAIVVLNYDQEMLSGEKGSSIKRPSLVKSQMLRLLFDGSTSAGQALDAAKLALSSETSSSCFKSESASVDDESSDQLMSNNGSSLKSEVDSREEILWELCVKRGPALLEPVAASTVLAELFDAPSHVNFSTPLGSLSEGDSVTVTEPVDSFVTDPAAAAHACMDDEPNYVEKDNRAPAGMGLVMRAVKRAPVVELSFSDKARPLLSEVATESNVCALAGSESEDRLDLPADCRFTVCIPLVSWYTHVLVSTNDDGRRTPKLTARTLIERVCTEFNKRVSAVTPNHVSILDPADLGLCWQDTPQGSGWIDNLEEIDCGSVSTTTGFCSRVLELRRLPSASICACIALPVSDGGRTLALLRIDTPFLVHDTSFVSRLNMFLRKDVSVPSLTASAGLCFVAGKTTVGALRELALDTLLAISHPQSDCVPDTRFFSLLWERQPNDLASSSAAKSAKMRSDNDQAGTKGEDWLMAHGIVSEQIAKISRSKGFSVFESICGRLRLAEDTQYRHYTLAAEKLTQNSLGLGGASSGCGSQSFALLPHERIVYLDDSVVHASGLLTVAASEWRVSQQHTILSNLAVSGTCSITNFRVIFTPLNRSSYTAHDEIQFPLQSIFEVTPVMIDTDKRQLHQAHAHNLLVECKDTRALMLGFRGGDLLSSFTRSLQRAMEDVVFAFMHRIQQSLETVMVDSGWNLRYDPRSEVKRLALETRISGSSGNAYRIAEVNSDYSICKTYPRSFVVPAEVSDEMLVHIAKYRSKGRLPVVSWVHPETEACLARCAQPRAGLLRSRCREDEFMVRSFVNKRIQSNHSAGIEEETVRPVVHLADARPVANAVANAFTGGGVERATHYAQEGCDIFVHFLDIGNIHVVREAYNRLLRLCRVASASATLSRTARDHFDQGLQFGLAKQLVDARLLAEIDAQIMHGETAHVKWLSKVEESGWLAMVSTVMQGATLIRDLLYSRGESVITHCSDGWDRTAQLCGLVQIQLDPFCRTVVGFEQLIEKEWIAFGHRFDVRLGRRSRISDRCVAPASSSVNTDSGHANEASPIFVVFLDCVWQILRQFPAYFQFNERFLLQIAEHSHSGQFGTFLGNCDAERQALDVAHGTMSLWTHLNGRIEEFLNPHFKAGGPSAIRPQTAMRCLHLWDAYWLRDDPATDHLRSQSDAVLDMHCGLADELHKLRAEHEDMSRRIAEYERMLASPVQNLPLP